jgi:anti-anti-sigma factor
VVSFPAPAPGFSRADLHVHTTYSDGTATPEDLLNYYALHSGFRVFAVTDHDTIDGALQARRFAGEHPDLFGHLDMIVGEEVSSKDGHVLGLFLKEWIPPGMDAARTVEAIHAQGGIAIAAHPYTNWMRFTGLLGVGDLIRTLPFDAVETRNSNFTEVFANRKAARRAAGMAQVGSSDGHFLDAIGRCHTDFPGSTADDLRQAIVGHTTVPGGGCYGLPTLLGFVVERIRVGKNILPNRDALRMASSEGDLKIIVHPDSGIDGAVLTLVGRLDALSMKGVKDALVSLTDAKVGVVLDLARVDFLASAGITALVAGAKNALKNGVAICLAAPSAACQRTLVAARLGAFLRSEPDVARARHRVAEKAPPAVAGAAAP